MQLRELGRSGLQVPPLAVGANVFGWTIDEARSFQVLDAFLDAGLHFIDTADMYSRWAPGNQGGESETILGRWMKQRGNRARVIIATKVGMDMGPGGKGLSRAHILASVEASLRRLQTDYIDLYQSHTDDPGVPMEETLSTYAELVTAGKVRAIGASNFDAARLREALDLSGARGYPPYTCLQPHYNLCERPAFEGPLQDLCVQQGLGVIPYFSLASGYLTGKYRSAADLATAARGGAVRKYLEGNGPRILAALDAVAAAHGATPGQVALAWLRQRPAVTAPIASATSTAQVAELAAGLRLVLDAGQMDALNAASAA